MKITPVQFYKNYFCTAKKNIDTKQTPANAIRENKTEIDWQGYNQHAFFKLMNAKRAQQLLEFCDDYNLDFRDINLLNQAFVHSSMLHHGVIRKRDTYETLEFFGDSLLNGSIKRMIVENKPDISAGDATIIANSLISNDALSICAKQMGIDKLILADLDVPKKACADVLEAIVGAIYINYEDSGYEKAHEFLKTIFEDTIKEKIASLEDECDYFEKISGLFENKILNLAPLQYSVKKIDKKLWKYSLTYRNSTITSVITDNKDEGLKMLYEHLQSLFENNCIYFKRVKNARNRTVDKITVHRNI